MPAPSIKHALWTAALLAVFAASCTRSHQPRNIIENAAYRLTIDVDSGGLHAVLEEKRSGLPMADGPVVYRSDAAGHENPATLFQLADPEVSAERHRLFVRGTLAGLQVEHAFTVPPDKPMMDEMMGWPKAAIERETQKGVDRSKITSGPTSTSPLASTPSTRACSSRCTT